nr:Putative uncharacterized protein [Moritella viscosa]
MLPKSRNRILPHHCDYHAFGNTLLAKLATSLTQCCPLLA